VDGFCARRRRFGGHSLSHGRTGRGIATTGTFCLDGAVVNVTIEQKQFLVDGLCRASIERHHLGAIPSPLDEPDGELPPPEPFVWTAPCVVNVTIEQQFLVDGRCRASIERHQLATTTRRVFPERPQGREGTPSLSFAPTDSHHRFDRLIPFISLPRVAMEQDTPDSSLPSNPSPRSARGGAPYTRHVATVPRVIRSQSRRRTQSAHSCRSGGRGRSQF
jgi:hypothetical protein